MPTDIERRQLLTAFTAGTTGLMVALNAKAEGASDTPEASEVVPGRLSLHAIDTYYGQTRAGLKIDLSILEGESYQLIKSVTTLERGRTESPLLEGAEMKVGRYELMLHLDDYFAEAEAPLPKPAFLQKVPIRFGVFAVDQIFHVPILFSPWNYSYYRGS